MAQYKFSHPKCPKCKEKANRILETLQAFAEIEIQDDGAGDYMGSSDMLYDSQVPVYVDNKTKIILICPNGHEWYSAWK